jgi:hypothetical protein
MGARTTVELSRYDLFKDVYSRSGYVPSRNTTSFKKGIGKHVKRSHNVMISVIILDKKNETPLFATVFVVLSTLHYYMFRPT